MPWSKLSRVECGVVDTTIQCPLNGTSTSVPLWSETPEETCLVWSFSLTDKEIT